MSVPPASVLLSAGWDARPPPSVPPARRLPGRRYERRDRREAIGTRVGGRRIPLPSDVAGRSVIARMGGARGDGGRDHARRSQRPSAARIAVCEREEGPSARSAIRGACGVSVAYLTRTPPAAPRTGLDQRLSLFPCSRVVEDEADFSLSSCWVDLGWRSFCGAALVDIPLLPGACGGQGASFPKETPAFVPPEGSPLSSGSLDDGTRPPPTTQQKERKDRQKHVFSISILRYK